MLLDIISLLLVFIGSTSAALYILFSYYKIKTGEPFSIKHMSCEKLKDFFIWLKENEHEIYITLIYYTIYVFVLVGLILVYHLV